MHPAELEKLPDHPCRHHLPRAADDNPASKGVDASVCDLGRVLDAVKLCKGRVVDGRLRIHAAIVAGLDDVPTEEIAEGEAASIVLQSLLARKHYTKSARAYLSGPLYDDQLSESHQRRLHNLRPGGFDASASKPRKYRNCTIGDTAEKIAESLGLSRRLFFQARDIRKQFDAGPDCLRDEWEPKILSGEMELGAVSQALAGRKATIGQPKKLQAELDLWEGKTKGIISARIFSTWGKASATTRRYYSAQIVEAVAKKWPEDLQDALLKALREKRRTRA